MAIFQDVANAVIGGDIERVKGLIKDLLDSGKDPLEIIDQGLIAGMDEVGVRFKAGEMFVPEVLMCAKTMAEGMSLIRPHLEGKDVKTHGTLLIGTVKSDLHDIGKNLVAMMVESAGFAVINLGTDVSPEAFVKAIQEHKPDILGMSALLTTTLPFMKETIEAIKEAGLRETVKIIVGGAPVTEEYARQIGADGYAPDAGSAAELCKKLVGAN
ncbi:dimethylamine corrinoid protein 1 [Thermacetogenium phaeum DSM 12270]|uniref:Dimethylamine corrinoid protein 1 n=1 Tax=Thermacetogenium phaeum (strain ATCC BAA-254 / DSM 26808 / PB) TaxID=1089553 RepID=K4LD80_THEPS|nr:corrinoid protein [Thermacetogenium phaeum]AFV10916.1 dimethylamine corrinoid protein 1 [Thermacetogenium phaeum DSM 12270]